MGALLRLRVTNCGSHDKHCRFTRIVDILGRPCARLLSRRTTPLRGRLARGGHFCPLPSRLRQSRTLSLLFGPYDRGLRLYGQLTSVLGRITRLCHGRTTSADSTLSRLCHRTLFGDFAVIGHFRTLLRDGSLRMRPIAFRHLLMHIVSATDVPFRKRPTVNVRIVKMLRAHGLSFHRIVLLSIGRNRLPGTNNSTSFVPCGLHGTFNVAAVSRGVTICTCCFCHLLRQTRGTALLCGAIDSKVGQKRVSHFVLRLLVR